MLAFFNLGQNAGFFACFLETAEGLFESLVVTNADQCHLNHLPLHVAEEKLLTAFSGFFLNLYGLESLPGVTKAKAFEELKK